jgi:hypothetical protein
MHPRDCTSCRRKHLTNHSLLQTPFYGFNKLETEEITLHKPPLCGRFALTRTGTSSFVNVGTIPTQFDLHITGLAILISSNVLKLPKDWNLDNDISIPLIGHTSRSPP